jgi:hypothetical protein
MSASTAPQDLTEQRYQKTFLAELRAAAIALPGSKEAKSHSL